MSVLSGNSLFSTRLSEFLIFAASLWPKHLRIGVHSSPVNELTNSASIYTYFASLRSVPRIESHVFPDRTISSGESIPSGFGARILEISGAMCFESFKWDTFSGMGLESGICICLKDGIPQ